MPSRIRKNNWQGQQKNRNSSQDMPAEPMDAATLMLSLVKEEIHCLTVNRQAQGQTPVTRPLQKPPFAQLSADG